MDIEEALIFFGCLVAAVILHEISHGVVALWFGDDTARRAGRLTLNPVPHIDPFGSIILPAMGALTGLPIIGFAKPVPVTPARLRNPRRDMLFVSLAGPFTNFLLMAAAALVTRWLLQGGGFLGTGIGAQDPNLAVRIFFAFAAINLLLGLFNFLPIPPLDGSVLIERVLPEAWLPGWHRFRPYGFLVLIVLVFSTNLVGRIIEPFLDALRDFVVA